METNKEYLQRFIDTCDQLLYNTSHLNAIKKYHFGTDHIKEFMSKQVEEITTETINRYASFCILCDRDNMPIIPFSDYLKQYGEQ